MGSLCSKENRDYSSINGGHLLPSAAAAAGAARANSVRQNGNHTLGSKLEEANAAANNKISKSSPSSETDDVSRSKEEDEEKEDKVKLSRVLSNRARNAKSKTTVVAKKSAAKVSEVLGRAGTAGFGKAVEALDTFGSSITNLGSGFGGGVAPKGNKIGILAFEVANTIVKGFSLKQSLSEASLQVLKKEILPSEGVQRLVSKDVDELWQIAASDKRHELKMFASEVVRFGNHCRAPEWHQLDRVFNRLGTEVPIPKQVPEEAEQVMLDLLTLAQNTAELYHELHALDRFKNDVRRKAEEDDLSSSHNKGDSLAMLKSDLKCQEKHVKLLKKRSLWSKIMEEVMEKLADVVYYLHQQLVHAFGEYSELEAAKLPKNQRLGAQGLSLHYANMINQIDSLVSRPNSVPPNTRDNLYQGLPPSIKVALRGAICASSSKEELTTIQIKEEMEKILEWLVPIASNTTKAHHGFGWVGEWASAGAALDRKQYGQDISLIQTLHHADPRITEDYILELLVWLNLLISRARSNLNGHRSPHKSPFRSPVKKTISLVRSPPQEEVVPSEKARELSKEEQEILKGAVWKKLTPGISKSQEFSARPKTLTTRLSKSHSHSPLPTSKTAAEAAPMYARRQLRPLQLEIDRSKLDRIDRIDSLGTGPASA